ncbi:hypothetical protein C1Y40_05606 [Mycobacterium talmoniae]|uniref:Uncharacterized protein n=1 Tax=Mycobacterium talmoniae TaxID=1858794 RepID=A0A2S8BC47_9MYCO|nr:hypothetical protein C1Y40_05606 [Mycobacterium talmoniae]
MAPNGIPSTSSVLIADGSTAVTDTPWQRSSSRRLRLNAVAACLDAV